MGADLNIHDIISQLIHVTNVDFSNPREQSIKNITPINNVSTSPSPPHEFSFYVDKETPKGAKFSFDDMMTVITSEELYLLYMELSREKFIVRFNKMVYCFVSEKLEEDRKRNVSDSNNIWMRPNAAFVEWFHENGIEIDKVKSFIEIEDDEYIYYKEKGLSEKNISYIRLCELTIKHIQENPQKEDGNTMSIRTAVKIVYKNNPGKFPTWGKNDLNTYYHLGQKLIINT